MSQAQADALRDAFLGNTAGQQQVSHLLIQEELNPETGTARAGIERAPVMRLLPLDGPLSRARA